MRALDRKMLRDLWSLKAQALAIALVVGAGIAMMVAYGSTFHTLEGARQLYYDQTRFADVFGQAKRVPQRVANQLAAIDGVQQVDTRVVAEVNLDVVDFDEPVVGRLISLPLPGEPALNRVFLRRGFWPDPARPRETVVSEAFASAHRLVLGDSLAAVINGRYRRLDIVGIGLSPEYVYSQPAGALLPDDQRFGVLWMGRQALATAFDLDGAFNDVALQLTADASLPAVLADTDRVLEPYGGLGAIPRSLQSSNWFVENELSELSSFATIQPIIFLSVAAFLLNIVFARLLSLQRPQIAALKALGYGNLALALHYGAMAIAVGLVGAVLGIFGGHRLGLGMTALYSDYFRFPRFVFEMPSLLLWTALLVSVGAAAFGAFSAVRRAVRIPPAEALRPEPPVAYRRGWIERLGLKKALPPEARMVLRHLARRPLRTSLAVLGLALSVAILVLGSSFFDALDEVIRLEFETARRHDATMTFFEDRSTAVVHAADRLPGVLRAEPFRTVPVRLRHGARSRQLAITGLPAVGELQRQVDIGAGPQPPPVEGLSLSAKLAEVLAIAPGQRLTVEVLTGRRTSAEVPVTAVVEEVMGLSAIMELGALQQLLGEEEALSGIHLSFDRRAGNQLFREVKALPTVASLALTSAAVESFRNTLAENLGVMIFFNILFGSVIATGVVYNTARVTLSELQRDLASLRILGFTRREISAILLGELAAITFLALPVGALLGFALTAMTLTMFDNELMRLPLAIEPSTFGGAMIIVLVAATVSALLVRRRLRRLDLVATLKTRE